MHLYQVSKKSKNFQTPKISTGFQWFCYCYTIDLILIRRSGWKSVLNIYTKKVVGVCSSHSYKNIYFSFTALWKLESLFILFKQNPIHPSAFHSWIIFSIAASKVKISKKPTRPWRARDRPKQLNQPPQRWQQSRKYPNIVPKLDFTALLCSILLQGQSEEFHVLQLSACSFPAVFLACLIMDLKLWK